MGVDFVGLMVGVLMGIYGKYDVMNIASLIFGHKEESWHLLLV